MSCDISFYFSDDGQVDSHCLSFVSMTVNSSPSNKKAINVERMVVFQNNKELNGEIGKLLTTEGNKV